MIKKNKLVFGVGINDYEGSTWKNGKRLKSYKVWNSMLERCYSEKYQSRCPTYIGCQVADEWLSFSNFKEWFDAHYIEGCHLDKDIKHSGNKVYSPEKCFFVTPELNKLLTHKRRSQGQYPAGVSFHKCTGKYRADIATKGKQASLGLFRTHEEAEKAYLIAKGNEVIRQAMLSTTPDRLRGALIKIGNRMLVGEAV